MKIWRLALALLLAAGTVAAYVYFPNPMESASRNGAAASADAAAQESPPPGGGESI